MNTIIDKQCACCGYPLTQYELDSDNIYCFDCVYIKPYDAAYYSPLDVIEGHRDENVYSL